jgi:hypothetical protein
MSRREAVPEPPSQQPGRADDGDDEPVEDFCEECDAELRASDRDDGFCPDCGGAV